MGEDPNNPNGILLPASLYFLKVSQLPKQRDQLESPTTNHSKIMGDSSHSNHNCDLHTTPLGVSLLSQELLQNFLRTPSPFPGQVLGTCNHTRSRVAVQQV